MPGAGWAWLSLPPALLPLLAPWGASAAAWRFEPQAAAPNWQWWTASWVHADWRHAALNAAALLLLSWLAGPRRGGQLLLLAACLPFLLSWQQWLLPDALPYLGASGVAYGWWAALAWWDWRERRGWLFAALLALRLAWQGLWPQSGSHGEPVLWSAHVGGAAFALLLLWLAERRRGRQ